MTEESTLRPRIGLVSWIIFYAPLPNVNSATFPPTPKPSSTAWPEAASTQGPVFRLCSLWISQGARVLSMLRLPRMKRNICTWLPTSDCELRDLDQDNRLHSVFGCVGERVRSADTDHDYGSRNLGTLLFCLVDTAYRLCSRRGRVLARIIILAL
jgi:hypothetical protein